MNNQAVATGRAVCKCCGKKIAKGVVCVYVTGWQASGYCHKTCNGPVADLIEAAENSLGGK